MALSTARAQPILVFPHWNDNPYLNLLYLAPRAGGRPIHRATTFSSLLASLQALPDGGVFHLHWTQPIIQRAINDEDASARLDLFEGALDAALLRGVTLIWTVHNRLPHECSFLEQELALARLLVDRASAIHIMIAGTSANVGDLYDIPSEKIVLVPHSSYQGVYDQSVSREQARAHWQISEDEKVILFFGQMRPYKGLDLLLEAVAAAAANDDRVTLLMGGKTHPDDLPAIEAQLPSDVRIIRHHAFIPDDEAQYWFRAADMAVFPYKNVLNSGSAHLSATFGVPAVLPRMPHFVDHFIDEPWVQFYDHVDPVASLTRIISDFSDPVGHYRESALHFSEKYTPFDMSRRYEALVQSLLAQRLAPVHG